MKLVCIDKKWLCQHPSKDPKYNRWRNKLVSTWNSNDILGYYFCKYMEIIGEESKELCLSNEKKYIRFKDGGIVSNHIVRASQFRDMFFSDTYKYIEYIDFIIPFVISDACYLTCNPTFDAVFCSYKTTLYDAYKCPDKFKKYKKLESKSASIELYSKLLKRKEL